MEGASYRLLKLVESYAVHPGATICKFIEETAFGGNTAVAFDAQQLLEDMPSTGANDIELLRDLLLQVNQVHEDLVGPVARVNFISFVTLHTYHALAQAAELSGNNKDKSIGIFVDSQRSAIEKIDVECCAKLMLEFVAVVRAKGHFVHPHLVMAEINSDMTNGREKTIDKDFLVSSDALCNYLSRNFAHDVGSNGYEAGRLAVECFLIIQSRLSTLFTAFQEEAAVHTVVKQIVHIVRDDDVGGWMAGGKSCVLPGVALLSLIRIGKKMDEAPGSCIISPLDAFAELCNEKEHYVELVLLFSCFEKSVESDNFQRIAALVESVYKGIVVIVIRGHVELSVLRSMESFGNAKRIVLVITSVDQASMMKLSLAFRIMPRALGLFLMDKSPGLLRVKVLFSHDSYRKRHKLDLERVLLVLHPLREETERVKEIPDVYVSVFLGARCRADCAFLERAFSHQLHHLVNLLCLPSPLNFVVPAYGTSEAYFLSYLDGILRLYKPVTEENIFKTRLVMALRDATVVYLEAVLKQSFGLTADEAFERISVSRQRFDKACLDDENREYHHVKLFPGCAGNENMLYDKAVPTPPLLISANQFARSNVLLADITEWEAQVEVTSAFLSIVGLQRPTRAIYSMNVFDPLSSGGDEVPQGICHLGTEKKEALLPPRSGSELALSYTSPVKKDVDGDTLKSFEKIHNESKKDQLSTLTSCVEMSSLNGATSDECGIISLFGSADVVKLSLESSHSIEENVKNELVVLPMEELLESTSEKGEHNKNKEISSFSGSISSMIEVLPSVEKRDEKSLFEKNHTTKVLLQSMQLQVESPHLALRRAMSTMRGTLGSSTVKPIPTLERRGTFSCLQNMGSKSSFVFVSESSVGLIEYKTVQCSEKSSFGAGDLTDFEKSVASTVLSYPSENVDERPMAESPVKENTEVTQYIDSPSNGSIYESNFSASLTYDSYSRGASESISSASSTIFSRSMSIAGLNSMSTSLVFPLKVGCLEAPPFKAFLDHQSRFTLRKMLDLHAEPAVFYEWSTLGERWNIVQSSVVVYPSSFACGSRRASYYVIDLNRLNYRMVGKRYLRSSTGEKQYFDDVSIHSVANHWARIFNSHAPPTNVQFVPAAVMELTARPSPMILAMEPQLKSGFIKYNNNDGCEPCDAHWTHQAFSHFTYYASEGKLMIVVIKAAGDLYTDLRIFTLDGEEYGSGNLGPKGMRRFLRTHKCNEVCAKLGLPRILHGRGGEPVHAGCPNTPPAHRAADSPEIFTPKLRRAHTFSALEMHKRQMPFSSHMFLLPEYRSLPRLVGHAQSSPGAKVQLPREKKNRIMRRIRLFFSRRIFFWHSNGHPRLRFEKDKEEDICSHVLR